MELKDSKYINKYGLLNAKLTDEVAENAPLWSIEYILLSENEEDVSDATCLLMNLLDYVDLCKTDTEGLYHQLPFEAELEKDRYTSPDQLIAFIAAFKLSKQEDKIEEVWSYLKRHLFTYNNLTGKRDFKRTMQPSCILFTGYLAGNKLLLPLLSLSLIYSCLSSKEETSGKLKAWMMFKTAEMTYTEKMCNMIIKANRLFRGWNKVFKVYFNEVEHPIRKLVDNQEG